MALAGGGAERLPSAAVSTATPAAPPAGSLLDKVERTAWRVPLPTRQLFVILALVAAAALALSGLIAGWVANRNDHIIDDAREQGLDLATAVTDFRTNLAAADAAAAATLIAGGLESTESRAQYDTDLLEASRALTDAGLVARPEDREDIRAMANGLVTYAGLVETSRANSRLGYPVGSAYLNQARDLANDDLVPRADRLRREGERRVAQASNSVGGPLSVLAVLLLVAAVVVLAGCAALVAGRSRRVIAHPALVGSLVAIVAALGVMLYGIVSQASDLRRAASDEIDAFVAANSTSSGLSNLRVTEISAVAARGSGAALYDEFDDAGQPSCSPAWSAAGSDPDAPLVSDLRTRIDDYVTVGAGRRAGDRRGRRQPCRRHHGAVAGGGWLGARLRHRRHRPEGRERPGRPVPAVSARGRVGGGAGRARDGRPRGALRRRGQRRGPPGAPGGAGGPGGRARRGRHAGSRAAVPVMPAHRPALDCQSTGAARVWPRSPSPRPSSQARAPPTSPSRCRGPRPRRPRLRRRRPRRRTRPAPPRTSRRACGPMAPRRRPWRRATSRAIRTWRRSAAGPAARGRRHVHDPVLQRQPRSGDFEGFDVEIAREVAAALFGVDPTPSSSWPSPTATGSTCWPTARSTWWSTPSRINCVRDDRIDFSSQYFSPASSCSCRVDDDATGIADLGGRRGRARPRARPAPTTCGHCPSRRRVVVGSPTRPTAWCCCSRARSTAISTDDTILAGMKAQDPNVEIVGDRSPPSPTASACRPTTPSGCGS